VQKGDWVLVHAAAGGMGTWLCQLLRAVGANIIATASTEAKRALAKKNGASYVFGYDTDALIEEVKKLTGANGVRAIFDGVGKSTFETDLKCIARKGSLVSFGNASGSVEPVPIM
jgi:NADPH2:quinone reductase